MPTSRTPDSRRPRQSPLSCRSCRAKKLRCDRLQPCGNCRSRRLQCDYYGDRSLPNVSPLASVDYHPIVGQSPRAEHPDLYAQNSELKARIERLERAMFGESPVEPVRESPAATSNPPTSSAMEQKANGATVDSQWLEGIGTYFENGGHELDAPTITVHNGNDFLYDSDYLPRTRPVSLPSRNLALECLDLYEVNVNLMHPIVHIPTVRDMIHTVYDKLSEGRRVDSGSMALVLIICACVSLWELHEAFEPRANDSARPSEVLATQALFAVDNAHVTSQGSIEAVQACILLCFHCCHFEGFSPHTRGLHARATTMARSLGLHRIDAPNSQPRAVSQSYTIESEDGMRVRSHLERTYSKAFSHSRFQTRAHVHLRLFAYAGGALEGTYSIHPQHMAVKLPRNLNDEDLSVCNSTFARPDDEPTIMSYYIQRLSLAVVCREIVDALASPSISLATGIVPYDKIIALDTKYCGLLSTLPKVFRLDEPLDTSARCGKSSPATTSLIRTTLHLFLHARRCKLHLPYLLRVKSDPRYAFSRETCLESARRVFEARDAHDVVQAYVAINGFCRLGATLIHLFYAAMVLVMDLCVNCEEGDRNAERVAEVQHAIKIMEHARTSSPIVARFLDSTMQILRKHQVSLPATERTNGAPNGGQGAIPSFAGDASQPARPSAHVPGRVTYSDDLGDRTTDASNGFEEIWQEYLYHGSSLDLQSWDALINDLEMKME